MKNPFVQDDGDDVKFIAIHVIIGWVLAAIVVVLLVIWLTSSVPTMFSGAWGMVPWHFQVLGILICPVLVPALFIAAFFVRKNAAKEDDPFERAKKQKAAKGLLIAAIILLVYMIIVWIIFIFSTIAYQATH